MKEVAATQDELENEGHGVCVYCLAKCEVSGVEAAKEPCPKCGLHGAYSWDNILDLRLLTIIDPDA